MCLYNSTHLVVSASLFFSALDKKCKVLIESGHDERFAPSSSLAELVKATEMENECAIPTAGLKWQSTYTRTWQGGNLRGWEISTAIITSTTDPATPA